MHEMSLENLEAVTGGIVVSRAKEIYKYLSDEDKKKVEEMEKEMLEKMNKKSDTGKGIFFQHRIEQYGAVASGGAHTT